MAPAVGVLLVAVVLTALVAAFAFNRRRMRKFGFQQLPQCIQAVQVSRLFGGETLSHEHDKRTTLCTTAYMHVSLSSLFCMFSCLSALISVKTACNSHFQASDFSPNQRVTALWVASFFTHTNTQNNRIWSTVCVCGVCCRFWMQMRWSTPMFSSRLPPTRFGPTSSPSTPACDPNSFPTPQLNRSPLPHSAPSAVIH